MVLFRENISVFFVHLSLIAKLTYRNFLVAFLLECSSGTLVNRGSFLANGVASKRHHQGSSNGFIYTFYAPLFLIWNFTSDQHPFKKGFNNS